MSWAGCWRGPPGRHGGHAISPKILDGRLTVVEFWATWCGPCIQELPHMRKLHARYGREGVVFLGISRDDDARAPLGTNA